MKHVPVVVVACMCLHNICIDESDAVVAALASDMEFDPVLEGESVPNLRMITLQNTVAEGRQGRRKDCETSDVRDQILKEICDLGLHRPKVRQWIE